MYIRRPVVIKALFHVWEVLLQHTSAKPSPVCHVLRWQSFLCHLPQSEKTQTVSKSTHRGFTCLQLSPCHHWVVWGDSHPSELVFTRVCLWVFYLGCKGSRLFLGMQRSCGVPSVSAWVVGGRHWGQVAESQLFTGSARMVSLWDWSKMKTSLYSKGWDGVTHTIEEGGTGSKEREDWAVARRTKGSLPLAGGPQGNRLSIVPELWGGEGGGPSASFSPPSASSSCRYSQTFFWVPVHLEKGSHWTLVLSLHWSAFVLDLPGHKAISFDVINYPAES